MTRTLAFTGRATTDITDAFEWYERQRSGLGDEFLGALARAYEFVELMPEAAPIVHRDLRRLLLRKFPFAIYFRLDAERVEIRACLHQRRHPGSWRRRA